MIERRVRRLFRARGLGAITFLFCLCLCLGCAGASHETRAEGIGKSATHGFSLPDLQGNRVALSAYAGKVLLLAFWDAACEPCLQELPLLQEIWERLRDRGLSMVAVNVDGPELRSMVQQIVGRYRFRFPVLLDQETEVISRYNPKLELPFTVLLDRSQHIAFFHQGFRPGDEKKIEEELLTLLGQPSP